MGVEGKRRVNFYYMLVSMLFNCHSELVGPGFGEFGGFSASRSAWFGFWDGFRFGVEDIVGPGFRSYLWG